MTAYVCTPLRAEAAALRGRVVPPVVRSGRGPHGRLPEDGRAPVLVAGVAGGLAPGLRAGDLVVADEVRIEDRAAPLSPPASPPASTPLPAAPLLAGALRRAGLPVHLGPVVSTPRVVTGAAGRRLATTGALAVDTESGYLAAQASGHLVVLRAVVDTPEHPLLRPGTAARGLRALWSLRSAAPVVDQWARAAGEREVVLASPRSFCAGVERAIEIVERALDRHGSPVYVRRQIVHNRHVVGDLEARGAVFVEEVEDIPPGSVAVLAAHGVAPAVREAAAERALQVVDATCPLVTKVHAEVRRFAARGDTVYLIGHHDHEEVVGTRGEAPGNVVVVADPEEAAGVPEPPDGDRVSYVMQTTLSLDEAERTAQVLRERFPGLTAPRRDDICYATTNRQHAVRAIARECDLVLVLGSQNSSNSHRLVEVAAQEGALAHLVDDAQEVDLRWLAGVRRIGVTAGASAPPGLVDELVRCLSGLGPLQVRETSVVEENVRFTLPREVS